MQITIDTDRDEVDQTTLNEIYYLAQNDESELIEREKEHWVLYALSILHPKDSGEKSRKDRIGDKINSILVVLKNEEKSPFYGQKLDDIENEVGDILSKLEEETNVKESSGVWKMEPEIID
jgi:hypothetical protein